jgi:5'-3' exoribonuclease 2
MAFLMTDAQSPLKEFYPTTFSVDLNGSPMKWHGVVKVPFIDEIRLHEVLDETELGLTDEEVSRNTFGETRIFIPVSLAPGKEFPGEISVRGPSYWGMIYRLNDEEDSEFMFRSPEMSLNMCVSFLLHGIQELPYAIGGGYDARKWETAWDKGAYDQEEIERSWELPLQIPGVTPGSDMMNRKKRIEKMRHLERLADRGEYRGGYACPPNWNDCAPGGHGCVYPCTGVSSLSLWNIYVYA